MEELKLFLSYVEDDEGERITDQLHNALSELHIGSVMAKHNINPGADWVETIRKHLCDSIALVCGNQRLFQERLGSTGDWVRAGAQIAGFVDQIRKG